MLLSICDPASIKPTVSHTRAPEMQPRPGPTSSGEGEDGYLKSVLGGNRSRHGEHRQLKSPHLKLLKGCACSRGLAAGLALHSCRRSLGFCVSQFPPLTGSPFPYLVQPALSRASSFSLTLTPFVSHIPPPDHSRHPVQGAGSCITVPFSLRALWS